MLADYMSKPVQGKLFIKFRKVIMGCEHISTLFDIYSSTEERVGNNGRLAAEPKNRTLTYAEDVRTENIVREQNRLIKNGLNPSTH